MTRRVRILHSNSTAWTVRRTCGGLAALLICVASTGCGGDDTGASDTISDVADNSQRPTTAAAVTPDSTNSSAPPVTKPSTAAGEPVKVGMINAEGGSIVSLPDAREAAEAVVAYANAELGGIGGRPIELIVCKTLGTPESSTACANELVEEDVIAVAIGSDTGPDVIVPIVTGAGIPYLAAGAISAAEATTPGSFILTAGTSGNLGAAALYAQDQGWETVSLVVVDVAAAVAVVNSVGAAAFESAGVGFHVTVAPPTAPDLTPQLAEAAASEPDAVILLGSAATCIAGFNAYETLGLTVPLILASNSCVGDEIEQAVPSDAYVGSLLTTAQFVGEGDHESQLFQRVMAQYAPDTDPTGFAQRGYASALGLIRALGPIEEPIGPATAWQAIEEAEAVPLPLGGGITFSCDGRTIAGQPSVCSAGTLIVEVAGDGVFDLVGTYDPAELLR